MQTADPAPVVRRRLGAVTKGLRDYLRISPNDGVVSRASVRAEMQVLLELATGEREPFEEDKVGA